MHSISRLIIASALVTLSFAALVSASETRQEQVARSGATVMPFDLARTRHFFDDNPTGGIETVTANDAQDSTQIALIRSHLATEAEHFNHGDFSDPAKIHGQAMPGLAALAAAGAKLRVTYQPLPAGASLTYASDDAATVGAVHAWFAAQRSDHGAHDHLHMHHE
jgi:hypothetical protein